MLRKFAAEAAIVAVRADGGGPWGSCGTCCAVLAKGLVTGAGAALGPACAKGLLEEKGGWPGRGVGFSSRLSRSSPTGAAVAVDAVGRPAHRGSVGVGTGMGPPNKSTWGAGVAAGMPAKGLLEGAAVGAGLGGVGLGAEEVQAGPEPTPTLDHTSLVTHACQVSRATLMVSSAVSSCDN